MDNKLSKSYKVNKWIDFIMYAILILLPFMKINVGINISDQGYNLANFELFPDMNPTWRVATFLANVIGKGLTYLPFGHSLLGMNVYCTFLMSLVVAVLFYVLKEDYSKYMVFAGLVLSICLSWAPKVSLYLYLSYYFLALASLFIVQGVKKSQRGWLFAAGILLGWNLFNKFPNIVQCSLILAVIYACFLYHRKVKESIIQCLVCIGGYLTAVLPAYLLIELLWGKGTYVGMIQNLFGMTETASSYSPFHMFTSVWESYCSHWKWYCPFLILILVGVAVYGFKLKKWMRYVFVGLFVTAFLIILRVDWYWGKLNINYTSYDSIHTWGIVFLMLSIGVLILMFLLPRVEKEKKIYAMIALIIVFFSPLGSNNVLYTNFNNLYLVAPVVCGSIYELCSIKSTGNGLWRFSTVPIKLGSYMLVSLIVFQAFMFHAFFVYGGSGIAKESRAYVENNDMLKGVLTSEENAEALYGLSECIQVNGLKGKGCIVYSNAPMVFYAMELKCAIGHTWPSLDSYTIEEFKSDMDSLEEYPVIIYETRYYNNLVDTIPEGDVKAFYINALLKTGEYQEIFRNAHYAVCIPAKP